MENRNKQEKLIRSLISLKHRCQQIMNERLSFPFRVKDVLLLAPINLRDFHSDYEETLKSVKNFASNDKNLNLELNKFPVIKTERYENTIFRRALLLLTAFLFFFPFGIYIYYHLLSRRGELKSKLMEITNTCHALVSLIQNLK